MNNYELMKRRLETRGGIRQEDRMIKDKWKSLQTALEYSYQGCDVRVVQHFDANLTTPLGEVRALINPNKLVQDYDDKVLSVDYNKNFDCGVIFEWINTGSYWIIYNQQLTEDAYFRGNIRRCKYQIKFKNPSGQECITWAAIRGPVETNINSVQKNQIRLDVPNHSLNILIPNNPNTLDYFVRYKEFLFQNKCWRIEAVDSISMTNVIEITATEDYINTSTDDVDNELKNGLVIAPVDPTPASGINGETFIKPRVAEKYSVETIGGQWSVANDAPVSICLIDDYSIELKWTKSTSGQFVLNWEKDDSHLEKTIVVESLF